MMVNFADTLLSQGSCLIKRCLLGCIRLYQLTISPILGPRCRFYPSCSSYAVEALQTHRLITSLRLITLRILRCHPGHPGGLDPVPHHCVDNKKNNASVNAARKTASNGKMHCKADTNNDTGAARKPA